MKTTPTIRHFLAALGGSIIAISSAQAQLYWDTNGSTDGFGTASGTWGTDAFWNDNATGVAGTFSTATTTASALNFGTATAGLGSGTINLGSGVQAASLTIGDASGAINFTGGSISGANTTTFTANGSSTANFSGGSFSFANAGARTVALSGTSTNENIFGYNIANSNDSTGYTDVNKTGTGTWVLTGTNTNRDASVPGTSMPTGRSYFVREGLLIFRGAQSMQDIGNMELDKNATNDAIIRLQSDASVTLNYSAIRVQSATGNILQVDRQTAGNSDGLTFNLANSEPTSSSVNNNYFNTSNTVLNISAGPNITSGTPTLNISGSKLRVNNGSTGINQTLNANGVNVRINGIESGTNGNIRTLTMNLGGTSTANEVYGAISEYVANTTLSIDKEDAGTWTFSGANGYKGTTSVNGGTLALGADNTLPDVSNVSIGAATLRVNDSVNDTAGTLDVTAAATINLGSGATLAFADSSAVSWSGGTLTLTGTLDFSGTATSSLRFGTGNTALTSGPGSQLAAIFAVGFTNFRLNDSGYLIADSEGGSLYESWAGPGVAFDGDANGDGVKNGLAFLLGALSPTSAVTVPTVTQTSGNLVLNFNMLKPANRGTATLSVQHSRDLGIDDPWTTVLVTDTNSGPTGGVTFGVGSGAGTTNPVTATISASEAGGTGKLFGRLKAVP